MKRRVVVGKKIAKVGGRCDRKLAGSPIERVESVLLKRSRRVGLGSKGSGWKLVGGGTAGGDSLPIYFFPAAFLGK